MQARFFLFPLFSMEQPALGINSLRRTLKKITMNLISPPFPLNALPDTARHAAHEIIQNTGAPDVIVGMTVLASMSIAAQLNFDVRLPHGTVRPVGSTLICLAMPSC